VGDTLVTTDKGNIPIEQICSDKDKYLCLSLDRKSGMLVWRKVLATREVRSNDTIRIKTVLGREIACTPEHKFFDGRRFREARTLRKGDRLYGLSKQEEQSLCDLWKAEGWQGVDLPKLLYAIKETPSPAEMCELQKVFLETLAGLQQSTEKQHRGEDVLFEGMCKRSTEETLRCLWKAIKTRTEVLLTDLQGESRATEETPRYCLSNVWENLQTNITSYEILLKGMCEQGSFSENDREGQFGLQRWKELCEAFQNLAESCIQARWLQMLYLWQGAENNNCDLEGAGSVEDKPCLPSYRRGRDKQCSSEHDYIVQNLSPTCSQGHEDRVAGLERDCQNEHTFYDLQIEDTQNYIACTLVVHNCTIVDDPVKNAEEAYNIKVLDGIWDWYRGTFLSRSENIGEGSIDIINHTRWSTQDLCGRILDNRDMGYKWLILSIPAEHEGHLACEDILPREKYDELKSVMDKNIFLANYHQTPLDVEGRLFGTLKTYDETALAKPFEKIIAYCDTADEGSDYLACYIGGVREGEGYILDIIYTQDKMQITEPLTARKLYENKVNTAKIESNNGGKGFARNVERLLWENHHSRQTHIDWFHQTQNKMARILTGATFVQDHVYFPKDWDIRFPELYQHITTFTKDGKNKHDDGVEALVEWGKMITGEGSINSYMEYLKKLKEGR
jgi:predicted phage terminase large subunit-like protein